MTFRWQSSRPNRTPSDRSTSNLSPLGTRTFPRGRSNRHNVPSGTVASRISHLQSLANTGVASPPTPTGTRRRETSRTGFGRRINSRFAQPASRNKNPDEDEYSQVDVRHSFLGLSNPRTNHEEEHARAQFKDQPTTSPRSCKSRLQTNAQLVKNSELLKARSKSSAETYLLSDDSADHSADTFRRDLGREHKLINSEISLITTSTMRRQSVIDLYHDYGIERPARLVSSRDPSRIDDTPRPPKPQWTCYNCSWINNSSVLNCWRCDMPADDGEIIDGSDGAGASKPEKQSRRSKRKPVMDPQTPTSPEAPGLSRKKSTPPIKFPSFDARVVNGNTKTSQSSSPISHLVSKELGQKPRIVSQHLAKQRTTPEKPIQPPGVPKLTPSRAQMRKVQESPFLKADPGSIVRSKKRPNNGSANTHEEAECVSPSCRAAYGGHKPHRHTITCSYNMRHIREHTDKGYTADISHMGEATASNQSFAIASESDSHVFHSAPEFRSDVSQPVKSESKGGVLSITRVKCNGYPRTGHGFHGSPFSPGAVGECQHCPDDCDCEACQKASHNVRCCVHRDHPKIPHYHKISRDEATDFATGNPAKHPIDSKPAIPLEGPIRTGTVVPPKSLARKKSSLPKPPVPPKKIAMSTFQPIRGQVKNINYTAPVESAVKDPSLSDATSAQSNKLTSLSTTRLQSIQTGITTPDQLALSQQYCQNKNLTAPPRKPELNGEAPVASQEATPSSKKTLKHFTSVFQLRDKASVPLLTKRLLEHQEDLRSRRGTQSEDSPPPAPHQAPNVMSKNPENSTPKCVTLPNQKKKLRLKDGSGIGATNNMDGSPPSLENQKLSENSMDRSRSSRGKIGKINDCGQVVEKKNVGDWKREELLYARSEEEMHECIWRRMFLEEQGGKGNGDGNQIDTDGGARAGIRGIKLVIQLFGREDLVLEGEF